jgi:hypothetical protein
VRYTLYPQNLKRLPILTDVRLQFQSSYAVILCTRYWMPVVSIEWWRRTCQIRQRGKRLLLALDLLAVVVITLHLRRYIMAVCTNCTERNYLASIWLIIYLKKHIFWTHANFSVPVHYNSIAWNSKGTQFVLTHSVTRRNNSGNYQHNINCDRTWPKSQSL